MPTNTLLKNLTFLFFGLMPCMPADAQHVAIDTSFGNGGVAVVSPLTEAETIIYHNNGDILGGGYTKYLGMGIGRLDKDGAIESGFGTNGISTSVDMSVVNAITVLPDNKIVIAGRRQYLGQNNCYVARLTDTGIRDGLFAGDGLSDMVYPNSEFTDIMQVAGGRLLAGGNSNNEAMLVRLKSDGTLDSSFGTNGRVMLALSGFKFVFQKFTKLSDGNILCVGYEYTSGIDTNLAAAKVDTSGNFVNSFASGGQFTFNYSAYVSLATTECLTQAIEQQGGKILLAGPTQSGPHHLQKKGVLLQLHSNGTPSTGLGGNAVLTLPYSFSHMVLQPDGKMLIGGVRDTGTPAQQIFYITRLKTDGQLDTSFNSTGYFEQQVSNGVVKLKSMSMQGNDKLLVNTSAIFGHPSIALLRLDLDAPVSVTALNTAPDDIHVYPNPFKNNFYISAPGNSIKSVQVTDALGRIVTTIERYQEGTPIELTQPAGIYHLNIATNDGYYINKAVIKTTE